MERGWEPWSFVFLRTLLHFLVCSKLWVNRGVASQGHMSTDRHVPSKSESHGAAQRVPGLCGGRGAVGVWIGMCSLPVRTPRRPTGRLAQSLGWKINSSRISRHQQQRVKANEEFFCTWAPGDYSGPCSREAARLPPPAVRSDDTRGPLAVCFMALTSRARGRA